MEGGVKEEDRLDRGPSQGRGSQSRAGGKKVSAAGEVGRPQECGKVLMSSEKVKHTESWNCGRVPGLCRMGGVGN